MAETRIYREGFFVIVESRFHVSEWRQPLKPTKKKLTPRQREVAQCIVDCKVNKEIAQKMNISVRAVKFHVSDLLQKFHVSSRQELARALNS